MDEELFMRILSRMTAPRKPGDTFGYVDATRQDSIASKALMETVDSIRTQNPDESLIMKTLSGISPQTPPGEEAHSEAIAGANAEFFLAALQRAHDAARSSGFRGADGYIYEGNATNIEKQKLRRARDERNTQLHLAAQGRRARERQERENKIRERYRTERNEKLLDQLPFLGMLNRLISGN